MSEPLPITANVLPGCQRSYETRVLDLNFQAASFILLASHKATWRSKHDSVLDSPGLRFAHSPSTNLDLALMHGFALQDILAPTSYPLPLHPNPAHRTPFHTTDVRARIHLARYGSIGHIAIDCHHLQGILRQDQSTSHVVLFPLI